MTGKTHLSCGIASSLFLCGDVVSGILLSVGSLLPDIDHKNSLFGKALPFIPKMIKHRTWTHSLLFLILCYFINVYLCIGCFVHLLLDMMTKQGCPLFYPFDIKIKLPFASLIKTDGKFEKLLFCISVLTIVFLSMRKYFPLLISNI